MRIDGRTVAFGLRARALRSLMRGVLPLAALLLLAAGQPAVALIYPDGVTATEGLTLSELVADGWTIVHNAPYADVTTTTQVDSWRTASGIGYGLVFVGAADDSGNILLGATGFANEVLTPTGSTTTASSYPSTNLYWYNVPGASIGFTPTISIALNAADITGIYTPNDGRNDLRLSWHLDVNAGGWRAGAIYDLNFAPTPKKVVLIKPDVNGDYDGDGVINGVDNCPLIANADQSDADSDGVGDVCDACPDDPGNDADHDGICGDVDPCPDDPTNDADGDGLCGGVDPCPNDPDNDADGDGFCANFDNCPDVFNPDQANADGDGRGDACDPYPTLGFVARPIAPQYALVGDSVNVTYRLEDRQDGRLLTELTGIRVTLTLTGSAVFGTTASQGILLAGGGTSRALVEFVEGLVTLPATDAAAEVTVLGGDDTEGNGIVILSSVVESFESGDGGFTHSGPNDPWEWGIPTSGPMGAASGVKVWATNLEGNYPDGVSASLVSPPILLGYGGSPRLEFQSWFESESCCDYGFVEVYSDLVGSWTTIDYFFGYRGGYNLQSYDLSPFVGSTIQTRFRFASDGSVVYPGWYIDDYSIRGLERTIEFLMPDGDTDGDGLTNAAELALGTDPRRPDTDGDGHLDSSDNCPLRTNANQADQVHPNGVGDACDDPDGDGVFDDTDNCPDLPSPDQNDDDGDGIGNVCDPCPADPFNDTDGDGICASGDNCPNVANPGQSDGDADGVGDACDTCVDIPNPQQDEQAACTQVTEDGGSCLETRIDLIGDNVNGTVTIADDVTIPPDSLRFEVLDSACAPGDYFVFLLNGYLLGNLAADPSNACTCGPQIQTFAVTDHNLLTSHWNVGGTNSFGFRKIGSGATFAWVRVVVNKHAAQDLACLLDIDGGNCTEPDLCAASFTFDPITIATPVQDQLTGLVPLIEVPFTQSELPERIDLSALENRQYSLCVESTPEQAGVLYASSREGILVTLDPATGQGTFVGYLPYASNEIEYNHLTGRAFSQLPDGNFYGTEFDVATGAGIGPIIYDGASYTGLEWLGPQLYGTVIYGPGGGSELRILDPFTGASSYVGVTGRGPISGLAYDEASGTLYGIDGGNGPAALLTINRVTGAASAVGSTGFQAGSLEFGPDGALYGGGTGSNAGLLFRIDRNTGAGTFVGYTGLPSVTGLMLVGAPTHRDCQTFTRNGEDTMTINGASCGAPPTAAIAGAGTPSECSSPAGAVVTLDGSPSSDPDSTPGTDDDIVLYEWFQDFGQPSQVLLGQGVSLGVTLSIGSHVITLRVTDRTGESDTETVTRSVVDTVPPGLTVQVLPASLWPANHRMVDIVASVTSQDVCGGGTVTLASVTSSEPDDAPGSGDGNTTNDIQDAATGTEDFQFKLRAERQSAEGGRTYTVVYQSTDDHGNASTRSASVSVAHDYGGVVDPVTVTVRKQSGYAVVSWGAVSGALYYNVVRGDVRNLHFGNGVISLGSVTCLAQHTQTTLVPDLGPPSAPDQTIFYVVEYNDGQSSSYGSPTASVETVVTPAEGACP